MAEWAPYEPLVVAVDGSECNRSAVDWATDEAALVGCDLLLVTVVDEPPQLVRHLSSHIGEDGAHLLLDELGTELRRVLVDTSVRTRVVAGSPVDVLVDQFFDAGMLVVGKRGLGAFSRLVVGSTSLGVAGRARNNVTVVPEAWKPADHRGLPVVVGVDPYRPDHHPIHLAFDRAERMGVPLVAVHGWHRPTAYSWENAGLNVLDARWELESEKVFEQVLATWRQRFPQVEARGLNVRTHPAAAILDAADDAQVVVLGRHPNSRGTGFSFGTTARAVLHHSPCPVMVIPTDGQMTPPVA